MLAGETNHVKASYLIKIIKKNHPIDTDETMDPDQDGVPD
jgi:hypothetical protein